ncbi:hypothetical protein BJ978_003095 [Agromyces terreus]|uniref:Uncharacterized protein n=1 Tax=Agromyces terreus TaxID=424795 RepID=A0A9X2HAH6_9MICO|nr:hypothetical protein [Agromyces terreus]MCP2372419.1 hypothetical protein [Agromyces terreus]
MTDANETEKHQHDAAAERAESEAERRLRDELAPEEEELEGWLPEATPTDGPAPAP